MRWNASMRARSTRLPAIVAAAALCACGERRPPPAPLVPVASAVDAGVDAPTIVEHADPPRIGPHTGMVIGAAVDRTGQIAVSLDSGGEVRLWLALDGTRPPVVLPFHGAMALDVARTATGISVGVVDPSGAAHLYRLSTDGGLYQVVDVPAVPQAVAIVAVTGGWLLARADQTLVRLDERGQQGASLERDGTRIAALVRSERGNAFALLTWRDDDQARAAIAPIAIAGDRLAWGTETALPREPKLPAELAVAPDETRFAYLAALPPPPTLPLPQQGITIRNEVAFDGGMFIPSDPANLVVVAAGTGVDQTPKAVASQSLENVDRVAFLEPTKLTVFTSGQDLSVALTPDAEPKGEKVDVIGAPSVAGGRVIGGAGSNLAVRSGDDIHYLGYRHTFASQASMSPDGARMAIVSNRDVVVEDVGGGNSHAFSIADDTMVRAIFVDPTHLLLFTQRGTWVLADAATGAMLDRGDSGPIASWGLYNARTGVLVGLSSPRKVIVARVDVTARPAVSKPVIVTEDVDMAWPIDATRPEDTALIIVARNVSYRRYRLDELGAPAKPQRKIETAPRAIGWIAPDGTIFDADGAVIAPPSPPAEAKPAPSPGPAKPSADLVRQQLAPDSRMQRPVAGVGRIHGLPGGAVLVLDQRGPLRFQDPSGTVAWSRTFLARPTDIAVGGGRVAVTTMDGAAVLDLATGAELYAACGWTFGRWDEVPGSGATSRHSLCE